MKKRAKNPDTNKKRVRVTMLKCRCFTCDSN